MRESRMHWRWRKKMLPRLLLKLWGSEKAAEHWSAKNPPEPY
jgi:hypothetical protein